MFGSVHYEAPYYSCPSQFDYKKTPTFIQYIATWPMYIHLAMMA